MDKETEKVTAEPEFFDHTEWRQEHFSKMTAEDLNEKAAAYARENHTPAPNVKII